MHLKKIKLAVIGLGYVGLPLAVEFGKKYKVVAYDFNKKRINELKAGIDNTLEVGNKKKILSKNILYTYNSKDLSECNFYIVAVPTPIFKNKQPDMSFLKNACKTVGSMINKKDIVVFESTVYPGATEEICIPIIEKHSNLKINQDFYAGYSPERINPGDKTHKLSDIIKVTSGSNSKVAKIIDSFYKSIIKAGTYAAPSIKVAEAAKVIENTQRDLNIALVNELSLIFHKMKIDTKEVLDAAATKWNFLKFSPGLVGGHCIGVDPYYLTYKAEELGYNPKIILAGRNLNNCIGNYVVKELISKMKNKNIKIKDSRILIMGITFKENCPDIRNSQVFKIIKNLKHQGAKVDCFDPWVTSANIKSNYKINLINKIKNNFYDSIVIAVPHKYFLKMGIKKIKKFTKLNNIIYDIKSIFPRSDSDARL